MSRSVSEIVSTLDPGANTPLPSELACELLESAEAASGSDDADLWRSYLHLTGRFPFLQALSTPEQRHRWAETAFRAILRSRYSLATLFAERVRLTPQRVLLRHADAREDSWTYAQTARRLSTLAGLFCRIEAEPRLAIFSENSIAGALCDLACLVHRILDVPLTVHGDVPTLVQIFDRLAINIAVADTRERLLRLQEVRSRTARPFCILALARWVDPPPAGVELLDEACAKLDLQGIDELLAARQSRPLTDVATVMFTSGSTGFPKGIAFTHYHLVSKRFARAAALPQVGDQEVLLCYLPLYHTFGRFLELLGMLYWNGTYVLVGNPSAESLISKLKDVQPTGLISVPLRWMQLRDHCVERFGDTTEAERIFRGVVGARLRWGLSAAGPLDARVFRFFHRLGVDLCSGFGMTEATGGVTMTPPGAYRDGTVGVPLPGIEVRLGALGELELKGPYVAHYLDEAGAPGAVPPQDPAEDWWLPTGDLFRAHADGYLEIVDRVKDIYKNARGQTVAPRRVERRFEGVPGVKRVFLAGDGRDSNVLLIVPDSEDPVLQGPEAVQRDYFHQIVAAANVDLAPFERVVSFAVVDRDFDLSKGELTPKGSYRRKKIEESFSSVIDRLYQANCVEFPSLRVCIPRWFFRDLALLESDIVAGQDELRVPSTGKRLAIVRQAGSATVRIGDLEYELSGNALDLGVLARQPRLWIGNPALVAFCPCKDGWDLPTPSVSDRVRLPADRDGARQIDTPPVLPLRDQRALQVHTLATLALFATDRIAVEAVEQLGAELRHVPAAMARVIRLRLEALARHPAEEVRCLAYRVLLTAEPAIDPADVFPAFVESGLTFLSEESIHAIAKSGLGDRGLQAVRLRLFHYRSQLQWPASETTREQFTRIFDLLADFARRNVAYYGPVRAELASWALNRRDPALAARAELRFGALEEWLESSLAKTVGPATLQGKVVLDDGLEPATVRRLQSILSHPTFLTESVMLAFDEPGFDLQQVQPGGIWVSRILSHHPTDLFRVGINLENGRHLDGGVVGGNELSGTQVPDTVYWLIALSDHPSYAAVMPRFGARDPGLGVISVAYVSDLTVWEKIREYSGAQTVRSCFARDHDWRRLFVRGMAAFFAVWHASGQRLVPGAITPSNVVVPDEDYREASSILSLAGWREYDEPLSLVMPLYRCFYQRTIAHYPKTEEKIKIDWIFDACIEALGTEEGEAFLAALDDGLSRAAPFPEQESVRGALGAYREARRLGPYLPLPLVCVLDRFEEWERANPGGTADARRDQVEQLHQLYRLDRFPEMLRYHLFWQTYFKRHGVGVHAAFERLIARLFRLSDVSAVNLEELYDLQATLVDPASREAFSAMVFPRAPGSRRLEVREVGAGHDRQVTVSTEITDRRGLRLTAREPLSPAEIGQLYRLVRESNHQAWISEHERHLVLTDSADRVVGGLTYLMQDEEVAYLTGIVVAGPLRGRGIGTALLQDFCARMAALGARLAKTNFIVRHFFTASGFRADARWGGLVRWLHPRGEALSLDDFPF